MFSLGNRSVIDSIIACIWMLRGLDSVNKAREVIQYKRSVYITHVRTQHHVQTYA